MNRMWYQQTKCVLKFKVLGAHLLIHFIQSSSLSGEPYPIVAYDNDSILILSF